MDTTLINTEYVINDSDTCLFYGYYVDKCSLKRGNGDKYFQLSYHESYLRLVTDDL